jgi:hypothetical protein
MRTIAKRTAVVATASVAMLGAGAAYAAWTATGSGTAYTKATTAGALTTDVSASTLAVGQLYPGGDGDVVVTLRNPNKYPVTVTSIRGGAITAADPAACAVTGVTFTDQAGSWLVPAEGTANVALTGVAHMSNESEDGCQGQTFSIAIHVSGSSSAS